jgi:hypothetical protein
MWGSLFESTENLKNSNKSIKPSKGPSKQGAPGSLYICTGEALVRLALFVDMWVGGIFPQALG